MGPTNGLFDSVARLRLRKRLTRRFAPNAASGRLVRLGCPSKRLDGGRDAKMKATEAYGRLRKVKKLFLKGFSRDRMTITGGRPIQPNST
jgi:hypothetical protein